MIVGLLLSLAGGLGAVVRFAVDTCVTARVRSTLPLATMGINVVGSFGAGVCFGRIATIGDAAAWTVMSTGFCGGFTTFSTAMVEAVRLQQAGTRAAALGSVVLTFAVALGAAAAGYALGA